MSKPRPVHPASVNTAQPADRLRRAGAWGSLRYDLKKPHKSQLRSQLRRLNELVFDIGDEARRATHRPRKGVPCHGGAGCPTLPRLQRRAGGGGRGDEADGAGHRLAHRRAAAGQEASVLAPGWRCAQRDAGQRERWIEHRAAVQRASRVARDTPPSIHLSTYQVSNRGNMCVWPGSHHKIHALTRRSPD